MAPPDYVTRLNLSCGVILGRFSNLEIFIERVGPLLLVGLARHEARRMFSVSFGIEHDHRRDASLEPLSAAAR
jgi:hypothetical protein